MKLKKILIVILVLMLCVPVYGGNMEKISLKQAVDLAIENSEDYQIADNEVLRRKQQYNQARSDIYPQIEGSLTWANNFEYPFAARPLVQDYSFDSGVSVSQLIWSFGKVSAAIKFADKYAAIGRLEKDSARMETAYMAKVTYNSVIFAQNLHKVLDDSLKNAQDNKKLLQKSSAAGRIPKRDLIKMDADIASRIPQVNDAKSALDSALRSLKVLIGFPAQDKIIASDDYASDYNKLDAVKYRTLMESKEPVLQAMTQGVDAQEYLIKARRAGYYPTVAAFGSWNEQAISDDADLYSGNADGYGIAGVKVSVPLWTGGSIAAELEQARIDKRNASLKLSKMKKQYYLELENAMSEYEEYLNTLEANRQAVELAEESYTMTRDLFEAGQLALSDLNDAELLLTSEKINEQRTLYNINVTVAKIERLAGIQ